MKISCNMAKDLLPLYIDNACSDDSKESVAAHLTSCDQCKAMYDMMKSDAITLSNKSDDTKVIKKIKRKINKRILVPIICILVLAIITSGGIYLVHDYKLDMIPTTYDEVTIDEISRLSDGKIIVHVFMPADYPGGPYNYCTTNDALSQLILNRTREKEDVDTDDIIFDDSFTDEQIKEFRALYEKQQNTPTKNDYYIIYPSDVQQIDFVSQYSNTNNLSLLGKIEWKVKHKNKDEHTVIYDSSKDTLQVASKQSEKHYKYYQSLPDDVEANIVEATSTE